MPRDVSLSDSKCWNGGHEWVKTKKSADSRVGGFSLLALVPVDGVDGSVAVQQDEHVLDLGAKNIFQCIFQGTGILSEII